MCKWGTNTYLDFEIPSYLSCTRKAKKKKVAVDSCISDTVYLFNLLGIKTSGSCCGHGSGEAVIEFIDGTEIRFKPY